MSPIVCAISFIGCLDLSSPCSDDCRGKELSANAYAFRCSGERCVECIANGDCKTACSNGRCLPCGPDVLCQDPTAACIDGSCARCETDQQCGEGRLCLEGLCGQACRYTGDCDGLPALRAATSSTARGSWFGCRWHSDIALGRRSLLCSGEGYLPDETVCDPCLASLTGRACPRCTPSGDCACDSDDECPGGLVCRGGVCGTCVRHEQCGTGAYCLEGRCTPDCTGTEDCPAGVCDPSEGRCRACLTDSDCEGPARCYEDGCVVPCTSDDACFAVACTDVGRCEGCEGLARP